MFEYQLAVVVEVLRDILSMKVVKVESKNSNLAVTKSHNVSIRLCSYQNKLYMEQIFLLPSYLRGLNSPRCSLETTRICIQQIQNL